MAITSKNPIVDVDVFQELALIREAVAQGSLPKVDMFSYVPTIIPMVHHEWGTGAILYLITVQCGLGAAGLVLTKLSLIAGIGISCYFCGRRSGAEAAVIALLAPMAILLGSIAFTNVRAQLFTLLLLGIFLVFLQQDRRGKRCRTGLWLVLYVIWVNVHGGCILGIALVGLCAIERVVAEVVRGQSPLDALRKGRHLMLTAACMAVLLPASPYGWHNIAFLRRCVMLDRSRWIAEWLPLWRLCDGASLTRGVVFILSLVIAAYAIVRGTSRSRWAPGAAFLLLMACQAALHYRHLSVYAVAWLCVVPGCLASTALGRAIKDTWEHKRGVLVLFWAGVFLYGCGYATRQRFWRLQVPGPSKRESCDPYPVGAVDYLKNQRFCGNLMVPYNAGSYVLWKLYPDVKVSVDSRFEVAYPTDWVVEVAMMYAGREGWQDTLSRYPTDAVLVPRGEALESLLANAQGQSAKPSSPAWRRVYVDDACPLFARADLEGELPYVDNKGIPMRGSFP